MQPSWQKLYENAGLCEYEAKVYVSLAAPIVTKARKVSMGCSVHRTKVYGTLKKLMEIGLVVEMLENRGNLRLYLPPSPLKPIFDPLREKPRT